MFKSLPILVIDDDEDDIYLLKILLEELYPEGEVIGFKNSDSAYQYLLQPSTTGLLILCDINLPKEDALEFNQRLNAEEAIYRKKIPFVFYTTLEDSWIINRVYSTNVVQGFFIKHADTEEVKKTLRTVISYWFTCCRPSL